MAKTEKKESHAKVALAEIKHRSLLSDDNKLKPLRQIFNGFEIEKRWVILTPEDDYSKQKNGVSLYDEALKNGFAIEQGYITDLDKAREMLDDLGIVPEFQPNTVRLRKTPTQLILTLKDKKETKRREVEWELDKKQFNQYWKLTKGKRITKRRYIKEVKGNELILDAFTDRYLLMAEIEVKDEKLLEGLPKLGFEVTTDSSWTNKSMAK